jgi:hypothetical protein
MCRVENNELARPVDGIERDDREVAVVFAFRTARDNKFANLTNRPSLLRKTWFVRIVPTKSFRSAYGRRVAYYLAGPLSVAVVLSSQMI